ncbi:MAG: pyruvate kinase [Candidatus Moraniibacteriota bacterium]|nr:MAG: pyruvate kinase [Candidatus Moranbacteria bacterium]
MEKKIIHKHTKIVATLGPVSESVEVLEKMIKNGLNVTRFNFSHGEYEWHERVMNNVRMAAKNVGVPIAILADLQGPRVRTHMSEELEIIDGETVRICDISMDDEEIAQKFSDQKVITLDCPKIIDSIAVGNDILIEDGLMKVKIVDIMDGYAVADVIDGGVIKNHKGVNIPDARIPLPTVTKKDYDDLAFALAHDVDYIALSFVRNGQDIVDVRKHMRKILGDEVSLPKIVSKIECKEALNNLERILCATDAVMIARGDLGIEMNPARIAILEKDILEKAIRHMRPVIVATQMLASMEHNPRATRAEISDVTNAVADHADAVMLSGESSMGTYPVDTVRTMAEVATQTEISPYDDVFDAMPLTFSSEEVRIAHGTYDFARELEAQAIVIYSESGYTARLLSHFRPDQNIIVVTNNQKTYHQLALPWGVKSFMCPGEQSREKCIENAIQQAKEKGVLHTGDLVITVLGTTKTGKKLTLTGTRIA